MLPKTVQSVAANTLLIVFTWQDSIYLIDSTDSKPNPILKIDKT